MSQSSVRQRQPARSSWSLRRHQGCSNENVKEITVELRHKMKKSGIKWSVRIETAANESKKTAIRLEWRQRRQNGNSAQGNESLRSLEQLECHTGVAQGLLCVCVDHLYRCKTSLRFLSGFVIIHDFTFMQGATGSLHGCRQRSSHAVD